MKSVSENSGTPDGAGNTGTVSGPGVAESECAGRTPPAPTILTVEECAELRELSDLQHRRQVYVTPLAETELARFHYLLEKWAPLRLLEMLLDTVDALRAGK